MAESVGGGKTQRDGGVPIVVLNPALDQAAAALLGGVLTSSDGRYGSD